MKYQFPAILSIDDVLPHIKGRDEFSVVDKGKYKVIGYNLLTNDTFCSFTDDDYGNAIRRECRGLIFDSKTNRLIRRPFHKFFNTREREETSSENIDVCGSYIMLHKLDGSMIAPFITSDKVLRWGTKAGETDTSAQILPFIESRSNYIEFALYTIGMFVTPIFEWMSEENRIVIDYGKPQLIVTSARNMITGEYLGYDVLAELCQQFGVPLVEKFNTKYLNASAIIEDVSQMVGIEGFVICFDNGHMAKIKTNQYVMLHRAKEKLLHERCVANMIVNNTIDDVIAHLPLFDVDRVNKYRTNFVEWFYQTATTYAQISYREIVVNNVDRKKFAIERSALFGPTASIIFSNFERIGKVSLDDWCREFEHLLQEKISSYTTSNSKWESFKKAMSAPEELSW